MKKLFFFVIAISLSFYSLSQNIIDRWDFKSITHENDTTFSSFGKFMTVSLCWTFSFHILNELRHLIWDLGYGFDLKVARITGLFVFWKSKC